MLFYFIKTHKLVLTLVLSLLLTNIFLITAYIYKDTSKIMLVAADKFGVRLLNEANYDQNTKDMVVTQYIHMFIDKYFNFNRKNFVSNVEYVKNNLMNERLWKNQEEEKYNKLYDFIQSKNSVVHSSKIQLIQFKEEENLYKVVISGKVKINDVEQKKDLALLLGLEDGRITDNNIWGIYIKELNRVDL